MSAPKPMHVPFLVEEPPQPTEYRLLRRREVERRTGLSRTSIYRLMAQGNFPKPVLIALRAVAWPEEEILAWQSTRKRAGGP